MKKINVKISANLKEKFVNKIEAGGWVAGPALGAIIEKFIEQEYGDLLEGNGE